MTVIREADILIRYKVEKGQLNAPEIQQVAKAHEEVANAVERTARAMRDSANVHGGDWFNRTDWAKYEQSQQQVQRATRETTRVTEEFGERSNHSYIRSVGGVTQLSRGIALLAADGSENSQKLLRNIIAVQGGVDVIRGSLQLMRLGPEFGAIAGVVTAGAAAWMLYAGEVDKVKKSLEATAAAATKERDRLTELAAKQEAISGESRMEKSGLAVGTSDKKAAIEKALAETRQREDEIREASSYSEGPRARAERQEDYWRGELKREQQNNGTGHRLGQWLMSKFGDESNEEFYTRRAGEAHAHEQAGRKSQADAAQRGIQLREDEKKLLEEQREQEISRIKEQEESQAKAIHDRLNPSDPVARGRIEAQQARYDADQRRLASQGEETGAIGPGFQYGRSFEESQTVGIRSNSEAQIQRVQRDSNAGIAAVADIITNFKNQLELLRSKLDSGASK